ncbi:hypothetical protein ABPG75_009317 [Micractinium tetrahymenae]
MRMARWAGWGRSRSMRRSSHSCDPAGHCWRSAGNTASAAGGYVAGNRCHAGVPAAAAAAAAAQHRTCRQDTWPIELAGRHSALPTLLLKATFQDCIHLHGLHRQLVETAGHTQCDTWP